jgi:hypothetical protein
LACCLSCWILSNFGSQIFFQWVVSLILLIFQELLVTLMIYLKMLLITFLNLIMLMLVLTSRLSLGLSVSGVIHLFMRMFLCDYLSLPLLVNGKVIGSTTHLITHSRPYRICCMAFLKQFGRHQQELHHELVDIFMGTWEYKNLHI